MKRLSQLALLFAMLFTVLIFAPALLSSQFSPYPLMKLGDVVDIATPLVLIPLYWLLFQLAPGRLPPRNQVLLFMLLAGAWAEGQGMHLSANSIGHLLEEGSDVYKLTYFYDEDLSHYIWHIGIIGLSALILLRQWQEPFSGQSEGLASLIAGGLIYGFTYSVAVLEAGTAPIGIPFAAAVALFGLVRGRKQFRAQPLLIFFVIAYGLAALLFLIWFIVYDGFPEPCATLNIC